MVSLEGKLPSVSESAAAVASELDAIRKVSGAEFEFSAGPLFTWTRIEPGKRYCVLAVVRKEEGEEPRYLSFSPFLRGAVSEGESPEEALENLKEALAGCIESYLAAGEAIPWEPVDRYEGESALQRWIEVNV